MKTQKKIALLLLDLLSRLIKFISLNLLRIFVIIAGFLLKHLITLIELSLIGLDKLGRIIKISLINEPDENQNSGSPLFSDGEINLMAIKLPDGIDTIQAIADHYNVSARQARKIKTAIENRLNVNSYKSA